MQSPILYTEFDVSVLSKYKECVIRILDSVGFWRIQDSRVQSPVLCMGLDVQVLLKSKECATSKDAAR